MSGAQHGLATQDYEEEEDLGEAGGEEIGKVAAAASVRKYGTHLGPISRSERMMSLLNRMSPYMIVSMFIIILFLVASIITNIRQVLVKYPYILDEVDVMSCCSYSRLRFWRPN